MADALSIGPWPQGVNNVDDPKSAGFQLSNKKPALLTKAQNVDIDRGGWVRRRVGRTKRAELTSAHSLYVSQDDRMFLVDEGVLYEVSPDYALTEVEPGLGDHPVSYEEVAGSIFYVNEAKVGAIGGFWGVAMPSSPFCTLGSGSLPEGRYLVAVTAVRDGVESGARQPAVAELTATGGLVMDVANIDANADALNVYVTQPNGKDLYWAGQYPATSPVTLESVIPTQDPLTTYGHYPPMPGQRIASFRGRMLVASGQNLYWSQPLAYHHFRVQTDVQLFSDRIVALGALDSGFYLAAGTRTYWVSGEDPDVWQPRLVDTRQVAEGAMLRLPAHKLPQLQSQGEVLVWATSDGFVVGTGEGIVHHLTDGRLAMDTFKQAALSYREESGLRQILMNLQTKQQDTRIGMTDRMNVRVIRANEAVGEP